MSYIFKSNLISWWQAHHVQQPELESQTKHSEQDCLQWPEQGWWPQMWPNLQQRNICKDFIPLVQIEQSFGSRYARICILSPSRIHIHINMGIRIQEVKFGGKNRKNARKLVVNVILFFKLSKFGPAPWFLTFKQSFLSFSTVHLVILYKFV